MLATSLVVTVNVDEKKSKLRRFDKVKLSKCPFVGKKIN
jgi:hypothetical protein